jgi:hypothetical protein
MNSNQTTTNNEGQAMSQGPGAIARYAPTTSVFFQYLNFISNTIMSNNKTILTAMTALVVMAMTVTTAWSQTYKPDWMTKAILAGGGNDVTNTVTLTVAPGGAAPITLTLPNGYAAGAGYVLTSTTSGGLSWVAPGTGITLNGDVTGSAGSTTIATTAGPHIVAALNTSGVAKSMNADVLNYDATLHVTSNALGFDLTHANAWTGQQTFTDATANAAAATFTNSFVNSSGTALGATISSTGAGTSNNTALQLTASGASGTNTALDVTGGSVKIEPFTVAGIVHNASTGVLSSSLIVNADITAATITGASIASATVANANLVNSTITVTSSGGTLTVPGSATALGGTANVDLDLTHANIWTGLQTISGAGKFKYVDGAQALGKVLTSDVNGVASWGAVSPGSLSLTDGHIFVGNGSGVAADVAMSGDVAITDVGATSVNAVHTAAGSSIVTAVNTNGSANSLNADVLKYNGSLTVSSNQLAINTANANSWTGTQTLGGVNLTATAYSSVASGETDNLALGSTNSYFLLSGNAAVANITGIAGGVAGRVIVLVNTGSKAITLNSDNASSTATNEFHFAGSSDVILASDGSVTLLYDGTLTKWRMIASE